MSCKLTHVTIFCVQSMNHHLMGWLSFNKGLQLLQYVGLTLLAFLFNLRFFIRIYSASYISSNLLVLLSTPSISQIDDVLDIDL
jgi:hypothetical protein